MQTYYQDTHATIYCGDLREVVSYVSGVDLILADPTYGQTRWPWDKWVPGWPTAVRRVLRRSGSMWCHGNFRLWWNHADEFRELWRPSQDIIWEKHNGSGFMNDRFRTVHEQPLHFYPKGVKWCDVYKSPVRTAGARKRVVRRHGGGNHTGLRGAYTYVSEEGGTLLMRSVIYARSCHRRGDNPTQKPAELTKPMIEYACPPGGLILVPFMGSGSEMRVAKDMGRRAIGIDIRESECEKAAKKLSGRLWDAEVQEMQDTCEAY